MKLIKEFARAADVQQDLKSSDGSDAGRNDTAGKAVDVRFSLMRNMINTNGGVTGSEVNDYLERAHELNDEVDTVGFAIETDDGDFIKVYVNATQADQFEQELSNLLGMDDDSEAALNQLAQKFDVVDVVWPTDPEGNPEDGHALNPEDDVSIDDDLSSMMGDDEVSVSSGEGNDTEVTADDELEIGSDGSIGADAGEVEGDNDEDDLGDALPADDEVASDDDDTEDKPKKKSLMKDIAGGGDKKDKEEPEASDDSDDSGKGPETVDTDTEDADADVDAEVGGNEETDDESESEEELDADGKPVKKAKKEKAKKEGEKEVTEEGLKPMKLSRLAAIAEAARDEVEAHVARELAARANKSGKFVIDCLMTGGSMGRRQYMHQEQGEVKYFNTMEEAEAAAKELHTKRNHTLARATYTFTPRMVEEQEDEMSIGSKFLERITEGKNMSMSELYKSKEASAFYYKKLETLSKQRALRLTANKFEVPIEDVEYAAVAYWPKLAESVLEADTSAEDVKLDAAWRGISSQLKRPYEKKIVQLFALLGVPGRYVQNVEGVVDAIRAGGDVVRRPGRKQTAFNAFFDSLKGGSAVSEAKKKGGRLQKVLETVMVALGFPEALVTTEGGSALGSTLPRAANKIEANSNAEAALMALAKAFGITSKQVNEDTAEIKIKVKKPIDANILSSFRALRCTKPDADGVSILKGPSEDIKKAKTVLGHRFVIVNEAKAFKVREPGWYVVDHMDKPVDGPYSEGNAKREAEEMSDEYAAKHGKGDISAFDVAYFSDYDIKRMNETTSVGSKFMDRVMAEDVDVGQDDFAQAVMQLVTALGIPEGILAPRRAAINKALREKKMSLTNRTMVEQRMEALVALIAKGTKKQPGQGVDKMQEALKEGLLMEAFGSLEAMVDAEMKQHNLEEPLSGPAMFSAYEGGGSHEETVLTVGVDPEAESDAKALRVGVDGPWDGTIHAKYFPNTKEGYKAALDYANLLRTWNAKTGGRPKGWKDAAPVTRLPADDKPEHFED